MQVQAQGGEGLVTFRSQVARLRLEPIQFPLGGFAPQRGGLGGVIGDLGGILGLVPAVTLRGEGLLRDLGGGQLAGGLF